MSHLIEQSCRVNLLRDKLREVEERVIQDDAIAAVAHLTGAGEQIDAERSKLENLLDCAGLAIGTAMAGTEMPPEVAEVTQHQETTAGLRSLVQQLEEAYVAYSAAAERERENLPELTVPDDLGHQLKGPESVVQHTEKDGLVDQIARTLPPSCACMTPKSVTLQASYPCKSEHHLLSCSGGHRFDSLLLSAGILHLVDVKRHTFLTGSIFAGALCATAKPVCRYVALCGDPGMGKSTIARLVENHHAVRGAFPRIFRVPGVGQTPNIREAFEKICKELFCSGLPLGKTKEEWREHLAAQLDRGARTLLVLDDVWTPDVLRDLNICTGGKHKLLVTSRNPCILSDFDETEQKVFGKELLLHDGHARDLLCMCAFPATCTPSQEDGWDVLIEAVRQRCKNVPLSLSVCGASPNARIGHFALLEIVLKQRFAAS
jgi:hypothetical protein